MSNFIPAKYRAFIYALLASAAGVNVVLHIVDDAVVAKIVKVATALGFGLAFANTPKD